MRSDPDSIGRRSLLRGLGIAMAAPLWTFGQPKRRLRIGHTGITWGFKPDDASTAIPEVGNLGYEGYETFGEYLDAWELKGGLKPVLDAAHLPLISAYCNVNLTDPTKRADEVSKIVRWAKLIQKCGGTTAVVGPNGVKRSSYDFKASRADVVAGLNEMSKAVSDVGIIAALHQHTGTCIETRDEVYAVLDAVDTKVRQVRAGRGPTRQRRRRPGESSERFPAADSTRTPEGLERRPALGGILSPGTRESGSPRGAGFTGAVQGYEDCHGGTGSERESAADPDRNRSHQQGISAQDGIHLSIRMRGISSCLLIALFGVSRRRRPRMTSRRWSSGRAVNATRSLRR